MLTPERLKEIKARCERATPGPWTSLSDDGRGLRTMNIKVVGRSPMMLVAQTAIGTTGGKIYDNGEDGRYDNAEFIAHAREDVPALVAEVEKLHWFLSELRKRIGHWRLEARNLCRDAEDEDDAGERDWLYGRADGLEWAADQLEAMLKELEAGLDADRQSSF